MNIKAGDKFKCIKTLEFDIDPCEIIYKKGKIYQSEIENCITNEQQNKLYDWSTSDPGKYFIKVSDSKAMRFNTNKPKYSLISLKELEPCAKVLEFGTEKYSRGNWKKGLKMSEILDSMLRHIAALQNGEWVDPESGLPHIGHIQCNALFLGGENNDIDLNFKDD